MYDLIVIGGGPAGTAAAIAARSSGALTGIPPSVLLLERGSFPRQKVCGEFVSAEALGILRQLLSPECCLLDSAPRLSHAKLYAPGRITASVAIAPAAASIARWELDAALWQTAIAAGADCQQGAEVTRVRQGDGAFAVSTTSAVFHGRSVIDASGRWSKLSARRVLGLTRGIGLTRRNGCGVGLKAHFECSASTKTGRRAATEAASPSTDLYFFPEGYCGVQPVAGGRLNVCALIWRGRASHLGEVFWLHRALWERSRAWTQVTEQVTTAPLLFGRPRAERDGVLCTGDAAGFIDPFAGDGISLALRSGRLAAHALAPFWRNEIPLSQALAAYCRAYENTFATAFRTAAVMRLILRAAPGAVQSGLWRGLRIPWVAKFVVQKTR
jgi:flavin-dependent dehydrogenase